MTRPDRDCVRSRLGAVSVVALLLASPTLVLADGAPLWQRLLRWSGGETSATPVETTVRGHMQTSVRQPAKPGDAERASAIVAAAKRVLERYRDVEVAERDGYRAFAPRGVVGEEVHYTNHWKAGREATTLDLEQPGSLLYRRTPAGMVAVGVMYTARADATPEQLDARLPLSVAVWHRHVHFCGWPAGTPRNDWDGPAARFGAGGSIASEEACAAAGGYWIPLILGWMTHVYPLERSAERIWLGEHAMELAEPERVKDGRDGHAEHHGHDGHRH